MADEEAPPAPAWKSAGGYFRSSSARLKAAASKAGEAVAGAAANAKEGWVTKVQPNITGAAEYSGTAIASTFQKTREGWTARVQPNIDAGLTTASRVAAGTGTMIRKGFQDTRERVASMQVGQRMGEATQLSYERSRTLLQRMGWSKPAESESSGKRVFGAPLEVVVKRQNARPIPLVVIKCADYILAEGLSCPYLFEHDGNANVTKELMRMFDTDGPTAAIPSGTSPLDVAQLLMVYLKCLPDPLLTFELYDKIAAADAAAPPARLKEIVGGIPVENQATLECLCSLLARVSARSAENKMDAESLAIEFAPLLLWRKGNPVPAAPAPDGAAAAADPSPEVADLSLAEGAAAAPVAGEGEPDGGAAAVPGEEEPKEADGKKAPPTVPEAAVPEEPHASSEEHRAVVSAVLCLIEQHDFIFSGAEPEEPEEKAAEEI